jgi:CRISPR-associated protein Csm3
MALIGKIKIKGSIKTLSGLHIGGSQTAMEIGAVDNPIIKTSKGEPYIPGSSLKGKLRNMLARAAGSKDVASDIILENSDSDIKYIAKLFGTPEDNKGKTGAEALLKIQDCFIAEKEAKLEVKMENSIQRLTGEANPRPLERVTNGNVFSLNMIMDVYDESFIKPCFNELALAIKLLELDHLGGGGSRGNGKVKFQIEGIKYYKLSGLSLDDSDGSNKELFSEFIQTVNEEL